MTPTKPGSTLEMDSTTPCDFASAIVFLEALPTWLFSIVLKCMLKREGEFDQSGRDRSLRHLIWNECLDELDLTPPIMKGVLYDV
jgi:hypothetical protein